VRRGYGDKRRPGHEVGQSGNRVRRQKQTVAACAGSHLLRDQNGGRRGYGGIYSRDIPPHANSCFLAFEIDCTARFYLGIFRFSLKDRRISQDSDW
jgi:hypothetical protein